MQPNFKDYTQEDLPRERLWRYGTKHLSNAELLAVLISSGNKQNSALGLAHQLTKAFDGLKGLGQASLEELMNTPGIGRSKASQILASFELARRFDRSTHERNVAFRSPEDVFNYVHRDIKYEEREHFIVLAVNTKNEIVGRHIVSVGTLNQTLVHPREVFNWAIKKSAAGIVIVHNHPSGHVEPSREDLVLTKRMCDAGDLIGIKVIDHIIVSNHEYYSLKANDNM